MQENTDSEYVFLNDEWEVLSRFKSKVLKRLDSNDHKLTNYQITVRDYKQKLVNRVKNKSEKTKIEYETALQLLDCEYVIYKLYARNEKLVELVKAVVKSGQKEKVMELVRWVTEDINQLHVQIEKILFMLLKLDKENETEGKTRRLDNHERVSLGDYLNDGEGTKAAVDGRPKKSYLCTCFKY